GPGESGKGGPDGDGKKRSPPAELLDVGEVGAQQRQEAPHEKARLEVAEEGTPAVAGGPERAASGGPPAGARSLVAAERGRLAREAPSRARQPERKVHVLVVGEERPVEDLAVRRHALQRRPAIQGRRRRDA